MWIEDVDACAQPHHFVVVFQHKNDGEICQENYNTNALNSFVKLIFHHGYEILNMLSCLIFFFHADDSSMST
jgi:hypothetical protein